MKNHSIKLPLLGSAFVGLSLCLGLCSAAPTEVASARVAMTVDAADEPRPALRYQLFHDAFDRIPGNAAIAYARATRLMVQNQDWNEQARQSGEWLQLSLDQLPVETVTAVLRSQAAALSELKKATLRERSDWEIPIHTEGVNALLPHLSELRSAIRLLALEIRLSILDRQFDEAIDGLRAGFTVARHCGDSTLLIEGLVGVAIAQQMLSVVEELVQQPGAPNLYWALTDLPPAYLTLWQATLWERSFIYAHLPILREIGKRPIVTADLLQAWNQLQHMGHPLGSDRSMEARDQAALAMAGLGWIGFPVARQGLLDQGATPEQVDGWSAAEVLVRFVGEGYFQQRDQFYKNLALPYPAAKQALARAEAGLEQALAQAPLQNVLSRMLLPALSRAVDRFAELDRQFAMLRCVEAVRFHAAQHKLQLPSALDQVDGMPIPLDPMSGLPFVYRIEGSTAVLEAPPAPEGAVRRPKTYEITIRR
jgi:hypothetical protein